MKRSALIAFAALLGSAVAANAFTVAPQSAPSGIQLVQEKMKDEKMSKDKMSDSKMDSGKMDKMSDGKMEKK